MGQNTRSPGDKNSRHEQPNKPSTLSSDLPVVRGNLIFWSGFQFIVLCLVLLLFTVAVVFFFSVYKKEVVTVPQVVGEPLVNALIELQEKHLAPKILLKISNESGDAGTILYQTPASGAKVVVGRKVLLTVSKGNLVDKVPDYTGQQLYSIQNDVNRLKYVAGNLEIGRIHYVVRPDVEIGSILAQKPKAKTPLTTPLVLELWVSGSKSEDSSTEQGTKTADN
ncbi:PASTA domain-containing protein [Candidatus Haliotispira prima]|uniref:PASTA domain-containing protein n=1 Tax=Candidatus Haliotispira prima TaxID=3034016 RepID=A0ABY8MJU6_9SPIO|nr:PASTA domain-containing protein [Candidatus Haliotispira prima]